MPIKHYTRQIRKNPKVHSKWDTWSDKQKFEAVTTYLLVGKWPLVSDATGIPIDTLKKWKQADWWKEYETEIRRSTNIEVGSKLAKVREKATEVVLDRLENGDMQFNPKTGKFHRAPVNAKVASDIMVKSIDREFILQKLEEKPQLKEEAILDRLDAIADKLLKAAGKTRPQGEIIDATIIDDQPDGQGPLGLEASIIDCDGSHHIEPPGLPSRSRNPIDPSSSSS